MKKHRNILLFILTALILTACGERQPERIQIVCTGDVHGHLFPHDFLTGDTVRGSLARVSSYLKEQRLQGTQLIYLDNGDMLQGTPATYCYNTYAIGHPHVAAEALNYLGCDAVALGNNDIATGGPTYRRYIDELSCPVVGGNILFENTDNPFFPPYTLIERGEVTIAVMGMTTPAIPHEMPHDLWRGMGFEDIEQSARRWMKHLHEHTSPDVVVGLFHSGYEGGIVSDTYIENAARDVAERVPGFDAIFYGHDHQARCTTAVNIEGDTVLLLNPGHAAHNVPTLDIIRNMQGGVSLEAALVDMDAYTPDPEYLEVFASHAERITKYVNHPIATSTCEASTRDALFGSSAFTDLVHQMQLDISGAKVSFAAPLVYDDSIPEGEVRVSDIYRLFPYENTLYVLWLTGREIKDYLECSYARWTARMTSPDDHLLLLDDSGEALKYPFYHFDSAAGILYEVDVTKPAGHRVRIKSMADGKPFGMDERYMVAMNSYRALGGGGLLTDGAGLTHEEMLDRIEYTSTADLRFYMLNYIEMRGSITSQPLHHWRFVPERWTVPASRRDSILLFK